MPKGYRLSVVLLAGKFKRKKRKVLAWTLFLSGLASTIPIAIRVFGKRQALLNTEIV
jgi:hypothetical protein